MAASFEAHVSQPFGSSLYSNTSIRADNGVVSNSVFRRSTVSQSSIKSVGEKSMLADVVDTLARRSSDAMISTKILETDYATVLEWIRSERMEKLPAEGSSYDKMLVWAALFVERLHSFSKAIEGFAGDSHLAAQLAYVHCASLLKLGEMNSSALMSLFGFFYRCSSGLGSVLDLGELFQVSSDIKDQLSLALADLVTLIVGIATHFRKILLRKDTCILISTPSFLTKSITSALEREGYDSAKVIDTKTIKRWLEPEDPVLANVVEATAQLAQEREESTCVWMMPYLNRFLKGNRQTLAISGNPGSGKSILATVINDHLQHPVGDVSYRTIFVPINSRVLANTMPRAIAKTILSQLFDQQIGNIRLYRVLSDTYRRCQETIDSEAYDDIIWGVLQRALEASRKDAKELVLIVDGVDEANGGEAALLKRLRHATHNAKSTKLILLTSQQESKTSQKGQDTVRVMPELILDDISAVVRSILQGSDAFTTAPQEQREIQVTRIAEASNGSFLWAKLASKQLRDEAPSNTQALIKAVNNLVSRKPTIKDIIHRTLHSNVTQEAIRLVVWLATACRPLQVQELSALLSVQQDKQKIIEQDRESPLQILKPVASLVFIQNNLVFLRHDRIRNSILEVFNHGNILPTIKNTNLDLAQRLLLYAKLAVPESRELALEPLESSFTRDLIERHPLLDFALRYWTHHLRTAMGCNTDQEISAAAKEIRNILPSSTTFSRLEMAIWQQKEAPVLVSFHDTQTRLYQSILSSKQPATLQTILCQVSFYWTIHEAPIQADHVFYNAIQICKELLSAQHSITMTVAQYFLDITTSQVTTSKTTTMARRIEVLHLLVESYKVLYGPTSEKLISILTQLAEHYHYIKEEHKAEEIRGSIGVHPPGGTQDSIKPQLPDDSLHIHLIGRPQSTVAGANLELDEIEMDVEVSGSFEFDSLLSKAGQYAKAGDHKAAELIYLEIWQRSSWESRVHRSLEWELRNVKAAQAYSKFLISQKRESEVAAVLWGFWQEYEQVSTTLDEAVVSELMQVAKLMKSVKLETVAMQVLKHCAQSISQHSSMYAELKQSIQSTFEYIIENESTATESSLEEIVFSTITTKQFSTKATTSLINIYLSQRRWHDATQAMKRVLRSIWPALFAPSFEDVVLPSKNVDYCVQLAERLSNCYRSRQRPAKEENIRLRVYRAARRGRSTGDKLRNRATTAILRFYERASKTDDLIRIHEEVLDDYIKQHGRTHPTVLKELWALATLTHLSPVCVDYYGQIVKILNKDKATCHPDAFEPLLIVVTELLTQGRFAEALQPCKTLFGTLQHPHINPKLKDQAFVKLTYERYVHCLRMTRADTVTIHDVTVQYRKACRSLFGVTATITVQATTTLAQICQESHEYRSEAVALYEELLKLKASQVDIDYDGIGATLDALYEEQEATLSSNTETMTTVEFHKVVSLHKKRLETTRSKHGWAHQESLSQMEKLETSAVNLCLAAKSIASSFISSRQVQRGKGMAQEIYRQIVARDIEVGFISFDLSTDRHQALVFLAQLEYSLQEREASSITMNEIYTSLVTEYVYFEQLRTAMKSKTSSFQSTLSIVHRLHGVLLATGRQSTATALIEKFTHYFISAESDTVDVTLAQGKVFVTTLLEYFRSHSSRDYINSVAIASYNRVTQLLASEEYDTAFDLASVSFKYIRAHHGFTSLTAVKLAFKLCLAISSRDIKSFVEPTVRKEMLGLSVEIVKGALDKFEQLKLDITQLDNVNLDRLIGLLDEQKEYSTLARVLTSLWNARETRSTSQQQHQYTLALGRMLVITRYMIDQHVDAIRLAEDIVYNCARVHGARHSSTVEMTVLLSQMYTSVAQGYQNKEDYRDLAYRYYKKAAVLHENALRSFVDPSYFSSSLGDRSSPGGSNPSSPGEAAEGDGKYVRQHLRLLKLAVERLGEWPKEYSEYETLNTDIFKAFGNELKGVDGVEKWDLKKFGCGQAEATDDLIMPASDEGVVLHERLAIPV
ncbi:NACHT domain protein [Aspergillus nomiae NRRL 13137]|uniref:NACHT domain protein n=1 Tax=Aspergillus nomiae NRRL (strain ATCC 15546 / NRRL 13137 / CBS 260.88 / M93) TaxID=1509407 RepID=A0A0L1JI43_ASPN3|nr:NACHT domain protein [Aspergillus nomiae NRRL 13137]KNG91392.1 NACHT domain protein [Aspergillus nomiae NRRL 13137]